MRTNTMRKLLGMALMLAMLGLWSCSKSESGYYDYVMDSSMVITKINAMKVMDNAGFDVKGGSIQMPSDLINLLGPDGREAADVLAKIKGVDPRSLLVTMNKVNGTDIPVILVTLTDKGDFEQSLKDFDFIDSGSDIYNKGDRDGTFIYIDGQIAVISAATFGSSPQDVLDKVKEAAKNDPVAEWKRSWLDDDDTMRMLVSNEQTLSSMPYSGMVRGYINQCYDGDWCSGYSAIEVDLKGSKAEVETKTLDSEGKTLKSLMVGDKVDKSLLKYLAPQDFTAMLFAINMERFCPMIEGVMSMVPGMREQVMPLLNTLAGKGMISFGYTNVNSMAGMSVNLALKAQKGQAQQAVDAIKALLEQNQVPYMANGDGLMIMLGFVPVSVKADGDNVVVALTEDNQTKTERVLKASDFGDDAFEAVAKVKKGDYDITYIALPFSVDVKISGENDECNMEIALGETNQKFLEALISLAKTLN